MLIIWTRRPVKQDCGSGRIRLMYADPIKNRIQTDPPKDFMNGIRHYEKWNTVPHGSTSLLLILLQHVVIRIQQ